MKQNQENHQSQVRMASTAQTKTKYLGGMAGGPSLNLKAEEKYNTNHTKAARTMVTPRLYRMDLFSLSRSYIKIHKGGQPITQYYKGKVERAIENSSKQRKTIYPIPPPIQ